MVVAKKECSGCGGGRKTGQGKDGGVVLLYTDFLSPELETSSRKWQA